MKMKCSVIQDLMPSYVDEICSWDSRELVQEHVAECEQCKAKLEQMKNTQIIAGGASQKQVDYLKKIHTTILRKEWLGKFMLVILVFIEVSSIFSNTRIINYSVGTGLLFSTLLMFGAGLAGNYGFSGKRNSAAAQIGVSAMGALLLVIVNEYFMHNLVQETVPFPLTELYQAGPFLANCYRVIILAEALILFWNTFKKQNNAYATILNIVSISLAASVNDVLNNMEAFDSFRNHVYRSIAFQFMLAVLGIVVCFFLRNWKKNETADHDK